MIVCMLVASTVLCVVQLLQENGPAAMSRSKSTNAQDLHVILDGINKSVIVCHAFVSFVMSWINISQKK